MLRVNETFGPTVQGEGPCTGRRAVFLRTVGCNLDCTWCDTPYTWDWTRFNQEAETHPWDEDTLVKHLGTLGLDTSGTILVITGGEPLTQASACSHIAALVHDRYRSDVWIETNGTRPPLRFDDGIRMVHANHVVSPKLASSGVDTTKRYRPAHLAALADAGAHFKFVVCSTADLDHVDWYVREFAIDPGHVWIMPEGTHGDVLLKRARLVVDETVARGWNLSLRAHTLLWGDERCR